MVDRSKPINPRTSDRAASEISARMRVASGAALILTIALIVI